MNDIINVCYVVATLFDWLISVFIFENFFAPNFPGQLFQDSYFSVSFFSWDYFKRQKEKHLLKYLKTSFHQPRVPLYILFKQFSSGFKLADCILFKS